MTTGHLQFFQDIILCRQLADFVQRTQWVIRVDLALPQHVRLRGDLGSSGRPILPVEGIGLAVIQATIREPRIMRYELTDFEWAAIKSFLPSKPRGILRC
jgi:hypothetical protein